MTSTDNANFTMLVLKNLSNVLAIVKQGRYEITGEKISMVNQELATAQSIIERMERGEMEVVSPLPTPREPVLEYPAAKEVIDVDPVST